MNAVSRFDTNRLKRWRGLPKGLVTVLYGAGGLLAAALVFQLFFRYQYLENGGVLWRVDRLNQQMCQVSIGAARCAPISPSISPVTSLSTSVSTSTSTSTDLKLKRRHKPH